MKIFSKRETLLQNMALMGIMAAVNVIIAVLTAVFPIVGLFLILVLPLTSVVTELYCKDRFYPIYALATIGLSLVATLWNIDTTIFYVIPSVVTGYLFGLACKKSISSVWSILSCSLIQFGLMLAFIPLIDALCQVSMFDAFKTLFNIENTDLAKLIFPLLIYVGSLVQTLLSYLIISGEVKKFGFEVKINQISKLIYQSILIALCLGVFGLMFLSLSVAYICLIICFYFAIFIVFDYIEEKQWRSVIVFATGIVIVIILFAFLFSLMPENSGFLLLAVLPFWIGVKALVDSIIKLVKNKLQNI